MSETLRSLEAIAGKTYSLFGEFTNTTTYFRQVRQYIDLLLQNEEDPEKLLLKLRREVAFVITKKLLFAVPAAISRQICYRILERHFLLSLQEQHNIFTRYHCLRDLKEYWVRVKGNIISICWRVS